MSKLLLRILLFCVPVLLFAQAPMTSSSYQPGTITQVRLHQGAETSEQSQRLYEVSVKVNGTTYVVLTTPPSGESTIFHAVGRQVLVQVGDNAIIWNDILGQSHEVPIIARGPITGGSYSQN
jgi:hypothetical protein